MCSEVCFGSYRVEYEWLSVYVDVCRFCQRSVWLVYSYILCLFSEFYISDIHLHFRDAIFSLFLIDMFRDTIFSSISSFSLSDESCSGIYILCLTAAFTPVLHNVLHNIIPVSAGVLLTHCGRLNISFYCFISE